MRWRLLLIISACVNVALLGAWAWRARQTPPPAPDATTEVEPKTRTHVEVRRQFFLWSELESNDYVTYIDNLRAVSCPEQTIRDIIIADVNALYARRRATEIQTPEQQWWRATPDPAVLRTAREKLLALDAERRALLTRLLGQGWDQTEMISIRNPRGVVLDGPVLGLLPEDVKRRINEVVAASQQQMDQLLTRAKSEGRQPTAKELATLRDQTRVELQKILSPGQVEEFLLRYSHNATQLRSQLAALKHFNASPDEFRAMFRVNEQFESRIQSLTDSINPNDIAARQALEQQRDTALRTALGAERYAKYVALQDSDYRTAYAQALDAASPNSAATLYDINRETQAELARLKANTNYTAQQLAIELKRVELEQLKATAEAVGQTVPAGPDTPAPEPEPLPNRAHVIRSGETLGGLSTAYGVPVHVILEMNPGLQNGYLKAGQRVILPPLPSPTRQ
jgi:LysM repeat protein